MGKPNALSSLYGKGHAKAGAGKRNQTIITPHYIANRLYSFWPEGVACDPCSAPGQVVKAGFMPKDGLAVQWPCRTYCNPPYAELKKWLQHGCEFDEVVWLVPVRTHRRWFRGWLITYLSEKLFLDPVTFYGHDNAFPAPLMLGYQGRRTLKFLDHFADLGGLL